MFTQIYKNKRALLYKPPTCDTIKVILFVPGFPKYPGKSDDFVNFFLNRGYHVLVPMYSGTFDSGGTFSIDHAVQDVRKWYDFLTEGVICYGEKNCENISFSEIVLVSLSFGGLVAGLTLKKYRLPQIRKCIFISPLWNVEKFKKNTLHIQKADDAFRFMEFAYPFSYRFHNKKLFFDYIKGTKSISGAHSDFQDIEKDVLIFVGKDDYVTPKEMAKALTDTYDKSDLHVIDGGHASRIDQKAFTKIISQFL